MLPMFIEDAYELRACAERATPPFAAMIRHDAMMLLMPMPLLMLRLPRHDAAMLIRH